MKLLFISALLIVWTPPMRSTPCKTVVRLKQEAMEYACQTQRSSLQTAFGLIIIPSTIEKKGGGGLLGNGGLLGLGNSVIHGVLNLAGIKIHTVKLPEIEVKFLPNVGIRVSVGTELHISASVLLAGEISIKAGAGVTSDLKVARTGKGCPNIEVSACQSLIAGLQVTVAKINMIPGIVDLIKGHIEAVLNAQLCLAVSNVYLRLNAGLGLFAGAKVISSNLGMQYIMPAPPVVKNDYMDMDMNVEYTVHEQVVESPTGSNDFTLPPGAGNENSMVNMGFSSDFFSSMFTAFQTSEACDLEIPSSFASLSGNLQTSVLGSYIREINLKYPQSRSVKINLELTQTPIVTLSSNQLLVQITPSVQFYVEGSGTQHLMTLNVGARLIATLDVRRGMLTASVSLQGDLHLELATSSFGKCGCDPSVLAGYMRTVFEKAYLVHINAGLSVGISMPSLPNVQLINEVMEVKEDYAVMSCDLQYVK